MPYERPPLSKEFLLGTSGSVPVKDPAWYEQESVELLLGARATRLDLAASTVTLSGGAVLGYDQLLLATGVRPRRPRRPVRPFPPARPFPPSRRSSPGPPRDGLARLPSRCVRHWPRSSIPTSA